MKIRLFNLLICLACLALCTTSLLVSLRWPLVGDSVLMHYVVFLQQHGMVPYRQISEMNMPMSYMTERLAMYVFGAGSLAWRFYDAALTSVIVLCCAFLLAKRSIAAGIFAGSVFAAVHLQDGVHMAGQRDLLIAALQALSACCIYASSRSVSLVDSLPLSPILPSKLPSNTPYFLILIGYIAAGLGACIKPPALIFPLLLIGLQLRSRPEIGGKTLITKTALSLAGLSVPVAISAFYLWQFQALSSFAEALRGLVLYHARVERRPLLFLLGHIWSPLAFLGIVTVLILGSMRARMLSAIVGRIAAVGMIAGLASYLLQGKGFPYQRYPFLLWLLVLCADCSWSVVQAPSVQMRFGTDKVPKIASFSAIAGGLLIATFGLARATRFSKQDPYQPLAGDLWHLGLSKPGTSVQCLDTAGPCIGALYELRIPQSTGFIYDCYLLNGGDATVQQQRSAFVKQWQAARPQFLVLTNSKCFTGTRTFDKYADWPWMQNELTAYRPLLERQPETALRLWSRSEQPYAYRILVRRDSDGHRR